MHVHPVHPPWVRPWPGIFPFTCCRWFGDSRSEKGELAGFSKARRARDIPLYLLPVVGRQQICEGRVGWILKGQKGQGYSPLPAAGGWETADLRRGSWLDSQRLTTPEYAPILAVPKYKLSTHYNLLQKKSRVIITKASNQEMD
jgi:hypothetical protein